MIKRPVKARVPVPLRSVGGDAGEPLVALDKARTSMVSAVSMQGADVLDNSKKKIGVVSDVLVNSASGSATAVVRLGNAIGAGAKHIAVPFSELKVKSNGSRLEAVVEFGRGAIESFPDFKATQ
ncbi:MAG TPA: PRC-barrel domain-containing protein [Beijerinckiaceae bacterium]|nr:PRC-barrel domain-containing protein [Beijerinckiaceae bacterium]